MRYRFVIFFLISLLSFSCMKEGVNPVSPSQSQTAPKRVHITVDVEDNANTKGTSTANETGITLLQVFVFNPDGSLDAYGYGYTASLTLSVTTGSKDIYAVVNAPSLSSVTTKDGLLSSYTYLPDNSLTALQMIGTVTYNVTSNITGSIPILVSRIVARIAINKITNGLLFPAYQIKTLTINKIYVINVPLQTTYARNVVYWWFHKMAYDTSVSGYMDYFLYDVISSGGTIAYGASYDTPHYFYVYPNPTATDSQSTTWSARYTRLVIEATLDGTTYYYPISIPNIESNKTYTVTDLHITRPGSDSPDIPVATGTLSATISITDWGTGFTRTITI
jgi:hypothetical protein